jgi:hypothetical protein
MLYSHSVEDSKFNLFASLVNTLLSGKREYQSVVDSIIKDSHDLLVENKSVYELNRDTFPIAVYLADQDPEFFKSIKIGERDVTEDDYKHIYNILRKENVQVSYY